MFLAVCSQYKVQTIGHHMCLVCTKWEGETLSRYRAQGDQIESMNVDEIPCDTFRQFNYSIFQKIQALVCVCLHIGLDFCFVFSFIRWMSWNIFWLFWLVSALNLYTDHWHDNTHWIYRMRDIHSFITRNFDCFVRVTFADSIVTLASECGTLSARTKWTDTHTRTIWTITTWRWNGKWKYSSPMARMLDVFNDRVKERNVWPWE